MLTYINSASLGGYHQLPQAGHREIHAKGVLPTAKNKIRAAPPSIGRRRPVFVDYRPFAAALSSPKSAAED
jgi:hypothetical protein